MTGLFVWIGRAALSLDLFCLYMVLSPNFGVPPRFVNIFPDASVWNHDIGNDMNSIHDDAINRCAHNERND